MQCLLFIWLYWGCSLPGAGAGRGGGTSSSAGSQHHSVGVSSAKAQHTPGNFGIGVDCLALRGNSTVQPGNKYIFCPVTVHLCQMLSVEYVNGNMSRFCSEDLLWTGRETQQEYRCSHCGVRIFPSHLLHCSTARSYRIG